MCVGSRMCECESDIGVHYLYVCVRSCVFEFMCVCVCECGYVCVCVM